MEDPNCSKPLSDTDERDVVTVCIDGASVDDWWENHDTSEKINIFLFWTLGVTQQVERAIPDVRIPVTDTIGSQPCHYCGAQVTVVERSAHISPSFSLLRSVCKDRLCNERFEDEVDDLRDQTASHVPLVVKMGAFQTAAAEIKSDGSCWYCGKPTATIMRRTAPISANVNFLRFVCADIECDQKFEAEAAQQRETHANGQILAGSPLRPPIAAVRQGDGDGAATATEVRK